METKINKLVKDTMQTGYARNLTSIYLTIIFTEVSGRDYVIRVLCFLF